LRRMISAPTREENFTMVQRFRKPNRLPNYDYSQYGSYHITICTHNRKNLFWINCSEWCLSKEGEIVDTAIRQIPKYYPQVILDHYVVMPNHVHILLTISDEDGRSTVSTIVGQMKRWATKRAGIPLWQKGFNDRVIRNDEEFYVKWRYIETNPLRWETDEFFYYE